MNTVILVIHLMIAAALVGIVLVQKSEGGALGIGGGGGSGFMTGRGAANLLTRITSVLAAAFFGTSILLAILASQSAEPTSILNRGEQTQSGDAPSGGAPSSLPKLSPIVPPSSGSGGSSGPQVPQSQ